MQNRVRVFLGIFCLAILLSGCSWLGHSSGFQAVGKRPEVAKLVATDLVMAIVQLQEMQGDDLVIQAPLKVDDPFAVHAIDQLRSAGFSVEQVPAPLLALR